MLISCIKVFGSTSLHWYFLIEQFRPLMGLSGTDWLSAPFHFYVLLGSQSLRVRHIRKPENVVYDMINVYIKKGQ